MQQATGVAAGLFLVFILLDAMAPRAADAMCCACGNCPGAAFCVDGLSDSLACATLCDGSGCTTTVFASADTCEGGCDGAPVAATATASNTPTVTATATATGTHTSTGTATQTATATATATATGTQTSTGAATQTATATATATATGTQVSTGTATPTATAAASATETPTASPTETAALSGQIVYYVGDRPVPGADLALAAGATETTATDANGNYGFASVETGAQTLDVTKQGDFNVAITALDGSFVLEFVAGLRPFVADQRLAADVTGNGTISALDGTRILQLAAGELLRFPVALQCQSDWAFRPTPSMVPDQTLVEPDTSNFMCTRGAIEYGSLTPPIVDQDFTAILFGDTTGNWMPDAP